MPDAWILPRDKQSILWRRADAGTYRAGGARVVEVGPVPMPPRALHALDLEADTLVYAHEGALTVVRGLLRGERAAATVKLPQGSVIHALTVIDEVVFTGGDAGPGMLGWVDLRAELRWQGIEVPSKVRLPRKGVDGLVLHGERLIAVDDMVIPLYLLVLDVARPREPRVVEIRRLKPHSTAERIFSVGSSGDTMALLSMSGNHGVFSVHLALMDLPTLEEWATLTVQHEGQAFAVVESKVGLFKRVRIDAALVSLVS